MPIRQVQYCASGTKTKIASITSILYKNSRYRDHDNTGFSMQVLPLSLYKIIELPCQAMPQKLYFKKSLTRSCNFQYFFHLMFLSGLVFKDFASWKKSYIMTWLLIILIVNVAHSKCGIHKDLASPWHNTESNNDQFQLIFSSLKRKAIC